MRLLGDLQHAVVVAQGVVMTDDPLLLDAENVVEIADERDKRSFFLGRLDCEARIVLRPVYLGQPLVAALIVAGASSLINGGKRFCKVPNTRSMRPRLSGE